MTNGISDELWNHNRHPDLIFTAAKIVAYFSYIMSNKIMNCLAGDGSDDVSSKQNRVVNLTIVRLAHTRKGETHSVDASVQRENGMKNLFPPSHVMHRRSPTQLHSTKTTTKHYLSPNSPYCAISLDSIPKIRSQPTNKVWTDFLLSVYAFHLIRGDAESNERQCKLSTVNDAQCHMWVCENTQMNGNF